MFPRLLVRSSANFSRGHVGATNVRWAHSYPQLEVTVRPTALQGSRKSRSLRRDGLVPGVLYGLDDDKNVLKTLVSVDQTKLLKELREKQTAFENTVYELVLHNKSSNCNDEDELTSTAKYLVTPRQTQLNPVTNLPVAVNFLRYIPGNRLRIPIEFINSDLSQDLKRGCLLVRVNHFVECVCDAEVPNNIIVDLSGVQKGDVIRLNALQLPPKVRPAKTVPSDFVVAVIKAGSKA